MAVSCFELPQNAEGGNGNTDSVVMLDCMVNDPSYSLEDISIVLGYSYRHVSRKIKEIYGDSLVNIRREIMFSSAKSLLICESEMTLDNIARISSFSSAYAISRAFRSTLGITPTEYRNQVLLKKTGEDQLGSELSNGANKKTTTYFRLKNIKRFRI